nr:YPDG domain-containing protein [Staphylococcus condimenti]
MAIQTQPGVTEFKGEKTKVYNNPLGKNEVASSGEDVPTLVGTANWKKNSGNAYRTDTKRYIELGTQGTKVESKEIPVNPDALVRFHFSYRGVYGTGEHAYIDSEQGVAYLVDAATGQKLTNLDKADEISTTSGYFGWTYAATIYKIPDNVNAVKIVLEAGDKPKNYVAAYPDADNPGYLFDNVGLELGPALESQQVLTRIAPDGTAEPNYYGKTKIYKRGDVLKYTLETSNNGGIYSDENSTIIKVPDGLSIKGDLPDGYTYDATNRTITVGNRSFDKTVSTINLEFQVDNDITENGIYFESYINFKFGSFYYGNAISDGSNIPHQTCFVGIDQKIYLDTVAPEAPTVDDIDTVAKNVPVTPPAATDTNKIEVTFPGANQPVTLTKDDNGTWLLDNTPVAVDNGKLLVPVPANLDLKPDTKITAVAYDVAGNESNPGEGNVTDEPPVIEASDVTIVRGEKHFDTPQDKTSYLKSLATVTDKEDDASTTDNKNTKFEVVDDSNFNPDVAGTYAITVKATDGDGKETTKTFNVTVAPNAADTHNPAYGKAETKPGAPIEVPQTGDNDLPKGTTFSVDPNDVPEGWTVTVDPDTGNVTATPDKDVKPGTSVDIPVKVTYPDGSEDQTTAKVTVVPTDADENTPAYGEASTKPDKEVVVPQNGDNDLPQGTKFSVDPNDVPEGWTVTVDPDTGDVTATPGKDVKPNTSVDIPVKVTYPDGSEDQTTAKVTVVPTDADENTPAYGEASTKPGKEVVVPQNGDNDLPQGTKFSVDPKDIPEGWTVTVDPDTGDVTATPGKDVEPGTSVDIPVKVTYPDGSEEQTPAKVTVVPTDADDNTPAYGDATTKPGKEVVVPQNGDKDLPEGTKFSVDPKDIPEGWAVTVDPDTGDVTATPGKDVKPGTSVDIPVKVTYPDGSEDQATAKVGVVSDDAADHTPAYEDANTKPGQPVTVKQTGDKDIPDGTTFSVDPKDVPEGWTVTVDPKTGDVTITPGKDVEPGTSVDIPVKVTYPDGTSETAPIKVSVTPTDADNHDPKYGDASTKPGAPVIVEQKGDKNLPDGTTFSVDPEDVPEGWEVKVDPKTGDVTATPGKDVEPGTSVDIPVKVTYPDGSEDQTTAKVSVIPTDADNHDPKYGDASTKPGAPVTVEQNGDKNLPDGTTFSVDPSDVPEGWEVKVDPKTGDVTATPGKDVKPGTSVEIPVKVTYPDGSEDQTTAKVSVIPTDADNHDPKYGDASTKPGAPVTVEQNGDRNLPDGTTFSVDPNAVPDGWTVTVDPKTGDVTATPGKDVQPGTSVEIPVKVTYPDGSTEEVGAKIKVVATDADNHNPKYGDATTKPGAPVTVEQKGDKNLPDGTTFSVDPSDVPEGWEVKVDPKTGDVTATPGKDVKPGTSVEIPVKVTYPDGSTEEVGAKVKVVETDADNNHPGYDKTDIEPGATITVHQTGDNTMPDGSKYEIVDGTKLPEGWTITIDSNTGDITAVAPKDAKPETTIEVPVLVTYPDGTTEQISIQLNVVEPKGDACDTDGKNNGKDGNNNGNNGTDNNNGSDNGKDGAGDNSGTNDANNGDNGSSNNNGNNGSNNGVNNNGAKTNDSSAVNTKDNKDKAVTAKSQQKSLPKTGTTESTMALGILAALAGFALLRRRKRAQK